MSLGWNAPVDGPSPASEEWTDCTTCAAWSTAEGLPTGTDWPQRGLWSVVGLLMSRPTLEKQQGQKMALGAPEQQAKEMLTGAVW